uniref:Uncharacterized protein LOC111104349 isoform X2 n=1 Tax=Crassostrea virginica TaxID=6565 RepID=A0A8B8ATG5_CRAVI|nr:uncharacterized protein LOC111104349 isoform X2 [Crassostrea virginica]
MKDVSFVSLPDKRRNKREYYKWLRLIRREASWKTTKYTRICSLHFVKVESSPTLFPYNFKKCTVRPTTNSTMDIHVISDQSSQESVQHTCTSLYEDDAKLPYVIGEVEVKNSEQSSTGYLTKEIHVLPSEHWMPLVDHPYCDVENKDPILISTGCQTDLSFDQMEYMERCINDKDSFFREVFVEKVTKSDSSVRQYTGISSITLLFGLFNIIYSFCPNLKFWNGPKSART